MVEQTGNIATTTRLAQAKSGKKAGHVAGKNNWRMTERAAAHARHRRGTRWRCARRARVHHA